jgi:uncharacterized protein
MTTYYADSSALVKRYVNEPGSAWVCAVCDPAAGHVLALGHIGLVEITAALAAKLRQGVLPDDILDGLLRDLEHDARDQYWLIEVDQAIILKAMALPRRHRLRGYDAVHLACALFLNDTLLSNGLPAPVVLTSDGDLLAAALAEGLLTDDPNLHP